jgi:hypothetical protein
MMDLAAAGLAGEAAYQRIQGRKPDGTPNPDYPAYLDLDNLIDYMILHIYASADDWPNHNWWAGRRRGAASQGFKFFAWDQEISNTSLDYAHTSWGPRFEDAAAPDTPSYLYAQLRANPSFRLRFADRVHRHLFGDGVLTARASGERLMRRAAEIDRAMVAESARWGDARRAAPYRREVEWLAEIARLRDQYWPALHPIALERFRRVGLYPSVAAPVLSRPGGRIEPGFPLEITAPGGVAYYTLDGTDPRLASGVLSPSARAVGQDPIVLGGTAVVKARARVGGAWSALAEGFFFIDVPLRITEVMYHPPDPPADSPHDDEDFEFIELANVGAASLRLAGARLSGAVRFDFAAGRIAELAPGELAVVVRDLAAFASRYGPGLPIAGEYAGELGNAGERVVLHGPLDEPIHDFRYSDRWYPETDGAGPSLEIRDPRADPGAWEAVASWRPSAREGGSPGAIDGILPPGGGRVPGDFTGDLVLNISDPVALLRYLFLDGSAALPCPGSVAEGGNLKVLDANGDGRADLTDAVHVLGHLFLGGPAPHLGRGCTRIEGCDGSCEPPPGG